MLTTWCRRRSSLSIACQPGVVVGRTSVFQAGKKVKAGLFSKIHTMGEDLKTLKFIVEEAWQWEKALINKSLRHLERRGLTFGQGLSQGPFFREHWAKYNFALFEKTKTKGGLQIKCLCSSSAQRPQSRTCLREHWAKYTSAVFEKTKTSQIYGFTVFLYFNSSRVQSAHDANLMLSGAPVVES